MTQKLKNCMPNWQSWLKLLKTSSWLLAISLSACASATEQYERNPLMEQILRPRTGYAGPTNRACVKWGKEDCDQWDVKVYLLTDKVTRERLRAVGMVCKVAGKRFKIDAETPRLRRDWKEKCGFLRLGRCTRSEYLPWGTAVDTEFMLDAKARCFNPKVYPWNEL